ncbi:MAG: hypothetical protein PHG66_05560 [Candidatus Colwellbacteria bacterium]|nr:hypothetical protein [Candidatus Colwellbacteria bacterium]
MSNHPQETGSDDYEPVDEQYKIIVSQIDTEERLCALFTELKDYTEGSVVPLLENLNIQILSDFLTPSRVKIF